jgi:hypothetical protein
VDGYRKIAEQAELQISHRTNAVELAKLVISRLEQDNSSLLVVNNLDDLKVLSVAENPNSKFLLPSTEQSRQHTLITTHNCYTDGIPAQGIEVTKFDRETSLTLLYKLSKSSPSSNSTKGQAGVKTVEELDHLALAIEQAAAYVREVAKKFSTFLINYIKYR